MRNLLLDPDPEFRNLEELADWELQCLWADLPDAHRWTHGNNGHLIRSREWSMRCDALASRIRSFTLHIGPVSWQNIGVPLLFPDAPHDTSWFQWANEQIGCEYKLPTVKEYKEIRKTYIATTGGHRL